MREAMETSLRALDCWLKSERCWRWCLHNNSAAAAVLVADDLIKNKDKTMQMSINWLHRYTMHSSILLFFCCNALYIVFVCSAFLCKCRLNVLWNKSSPTVQLMCCADAPIVWSKRQTRSQQRQARNRPPLDRYAHDFFSFFFLPTSSPLLFVRSSYWAYCT